MPLRFSFLKSIFVDGMSVKNVSPIFNSGSFKMENALLHRQNHCSLGPEVQGSWSFPSAILRLNSHKGMQLEGNFPSQIFSHSSLLQRQRGWQRGGKFPNKWQNVININITSRTRLHVRMDLLKLVSILRGMIFL